MIQIANIKASFLRIFPNMTRIVYILAKFSFHIVHIDPNLSYLPRAKIVQIYEII